MAVDGAADVGLDNAELAPNRLLGSDAGLSGALPDTDDEYWLAELMPYRSVSPVPPVAFGPVVANAALGLYALGSYGPPADGADAAASGCGDVEDEDNVGSDADGSELVADFVEAFGVDTSLSASAFAGEFGYVAGGALAAAADDDTGMDMLGGSAGVAAAVELAAGEFAVARFADDGGVAGVRPAMATGCGVD